MGGSLLCNQLKSQCGPVIGSELLPLLGDVKVSQAFIRRGHSKSGFEKDPVCRTESRVASTGIRACGDETDSAARKNKCESSCMLSRGIFKEPTRTLILDNYDSYTYNLYQLLSGINGVAPVVIRNDEITWSELRCMIYEERAFHNIVISPGPGSPTCAEDIGVCVQVLKECHDIPILGVCMGHQALGHAHGARIVHAPDPVHGRLSEVFHTGHPLFNQIPSGAGSGFKVVRYHSLMIDASTLPLNLVPTAWTVSSDTGDSFQFLDWSEKVGSPSISQSPAARATQRSYSDFGGAGLCGHAKDLCKGSTEQNNFSDKFDRSCERQLKNDKITCQWRNDGLATEPLRGRNLQFPGPGKKIQTHEQGRRVLMGVSHQSWPHHGVQFHPESIASSYGEQILGNFRRLTLEHWQKHIWNPPPFSKVYKIFSEKSMIPASLSVINLQPIPVSLATLSSANLSSETEVSGTVSNIPYQGSTVFPSRDHSRNEACNFGLFQKSSSLGDVPVVLRLHWTKLPGILNLVGGSVNLFCELFEKESVKDTFWLDSSTQDQGRARFSYMGGRGGHLWQRLTYHLSRKNTKEDKTCGVLKTEDAAGKVEVKVLANGFLSFLDKELQERRCNLEDSAVLPFDFSGGYVGYLGYELKLECGAKLNRHVSRFPDAMLFLVDQLIVVDHLHDDVYILAVFEEHKSHITDRQQQCKGLSTHELYVPASPAGTISSVRQVKSVPYLGETGSSVFPHMEERVAFVDPAINASSHLAAVTWVKDMEDKILHLRDEGMCSLIETLHMSRRTPFSSKEDNLQPPFSSRTSENAYIKDVRECLRFIKDGESYEVCLTTQLCRKMKSMDTFRLYMILRETNPAPYAAWLNFGEDGPCICSSSPERFLRLDRVGTLEAKPIKGTVPRGNSSLEDERLKFELQHSEKDQAENLMIVDLLRNDLGRVCKLGTVHVPTLMAVESYSTVHTLVSTVRGEKRPDMTPIDCVRAAFPGGSMTGAPKLRTMEIIDTIETGARGVYSGTLGFFSFGSAFDLNIVIRTLVIHEGEASIGTGGAVIALSDPAAEYEEMLLKTEAPIRAVSKFEKELSDIEQSEHRGPALPLSV